MLTGSQTSQQRQKQKLISVHKFGKLFLSTKVSPLSQDCFSYGMVFQNKRSDSYKVSADPDDWLAT